MRSAVVLPLILFFWRPLTPIIHVIAVSLFLAVIMSVCLNTAFQYGLSAGVGILIFQTDPFFILLFSFIHFSEKPTLQQMVGMIVAFGGVALIAFEQALYGSLLGAGIMLLAAASFAYAVVLAKRFNPKHIFNFQAWVYAVAVLPLFIIMTSTYGFHESIHEIQNASLKPLSAVVFSGVLSGFVAASLWNKMTIFYSPNKTAPYIYLVPFIGGFLSWLFLGETFTYMSLIAGAAILTGLAINQGYLLSSLFKKA